VFLETIKRVGPTWAWRTTHSKAQDQPSATTQNYFQKEYSMGLQNTGCWFLACVSFFIWRGQAGILFLFGNLAFQGHFLILFFLELLLVWRLLCSDFAANASLSSESGSESSDSVSVLRLSFLADWLALWRGLLMILSGRTS
jgi:hypothetical protein